MRDEFVVIPDTLIRWHRKGFACSGGGSPSRVVGPSSLPICGNSRPGRTPHLKQRWMTFVRNHAKAIVACDFLVVVTAGRSIGPLQVVPNVYESPFVRVY